jgi:uncharacterized protein (TIGR03067 family)
VKHSAWFACSLVSVLVLGLLRADEPRDDQVKKDLEQLQGTWIISELEIDGQRVDTSKLEGTKLTFKGDKYVVTVKDQSFEVTVTLDPTTKPKSVDMVFTDGPNKGKVHKGIYEIEGDTFKLCRPLNPESDRPRDFGTWPNTGVFYVIWKRDQ